MPGAINSQNHVTHWPSAISFDPRYVLVDKMFLLLRNLNIVEPLRKAELTSVMGDETN